MQNSLIHVLSKKYSLISLLGLKKKKGKKEKNQMVIKAESNPLPQVGIACNYNESLHTHQI